VAKNVPSFRFPFASLSKLPPEAQAAHLATFNALTDIYQAFALQKTNTSTASTTTINETVTGTTSGGGGSAGVTLFNGETGSVTFFPDLGLVNNQTGVTAYTLQSSDSGSTVILNDASAIAVGLNYNIGLPFYCWIANYGSGTATLTPSNVPSGVTSTISYPGNLAASSMPLASGLAAMISFDGNSWWGVLIPIGGGTGTVTSVTGTLPIVSTGGTTPVISVNKATSSTFGVVEPDNSTITISAGVISAVGAGVSQIVAGTNVTISPPGGTGAVTINATAGSYSLGGALSTGNFALGTGAGTGASISSVAGLDGNHTIVITTGSAPATSSPIYTCTFTATRGHTTYPIAAGVAVSYSGVNQIPYGSAIGGTSYALYSGGTALNAATTYAWSVSCP